MNLGLKNKMAFQGTVVSNAFIDTYMTAANGEYVKVFLYLLAMRGRRSPCLPLPTPWTIQRRT